jgi:membrane associated rhomboid family serine protease
MLIPIGHEDQQVRRLPWVTILLVAANVLVFLYTNQVAQQQAAETRQRVQEVVRYAADRPYLRVSEELRRVILPGPPRADLSSETVAREQARLDEMLAELRSGTKGNIYRTYGYVPAEPRLLTLFTSMFLHGGWMHLLGNMLFLWLAGGSLEDRWGRVLFLLLYLASGVVAALLHAAMTPHSPVPMVGASGAIAGLMGAFLVRLARTRIRFFYWFLIVRGTFVMPAFVALPLWLLQQFAMARSGAGGGIAVWAHIGGFAFGVLVALVVRLADFEKNVLAPAIARKTSWSPSEQLTAALEKLDRGGPEAGIRELVALLKQTPNSIEARAALVAAYTQAGDSASAGRESARLVSAYVVARDMDGGLAAFDEHRRAHPDVAVPLRSLLTLAAHREKQERHAEAADLYQKGIEAWPVDPLRPKALVAYGRLMLEFFQQPDAATTLLEEALRDPAAPPEFRRAAEELMAAARRDRPAAPPPAATPPEAGFEPTSLTASMPTVGEAPASSSEAETPSAEGATPGFIVRHDFAPESAPEPTPDEPAGGAQTFEVPTPETVREETVESTPSWRLLPVAMQAVGIDARGLRLQNREGKIGHLPWQGITGVSVARIDDPSRAEPPGGKLILDLLMAPKATPEGDVVRSVRLTDQDLAIPQLQGEPSAVRGFQRLVATVLKATGATPYPSRDDCLGLRGFPAFPDVGAYETALLACVRLAGN